MPAMVRSRLPGPLYVPGSSTTVPPVTLVLSASWIFAQGDAGVPQGCAATPLGAANTNGPEPGRTDAGTAADQALVTSAVFARTP